MYCPVKYYLQKVVGIRKPPTKVMIEGKIRHEVMEIFSKNEPALVQEFTKPLPSKEITLSYLSLLSEVIKQTFSYEYDQMRKFMVSPNSLRENIIVGLNQEIILRAKAVEHTMSLGFLGKELWQNLEPKYYSEFFIESPSMELKGKIDRVMLSKNSIVPFELKTRPVDKIYDTDEIQLTAYAMLLEEYFKQPIPTGIIESGNIRHTPDIKEEKKQKVLSLIKEIHDLEKPVFPKSFAKCQNCDFKEECDNL